MQSLRSTFPYLFKRGEHYRSATEEYPDRVSARMPEDMYPRFRGFLNNNIDVCSGCRYCADVCPVDCIRIETEPGPQKNVSWVSVFDIDHTRCLFCGLCSEVCPTGSLKHTKEYQASTQDEQTLVFSFGKGFASRETKELWIKQQMANEARTEELTMLEKSPIGAALKLKKSDDEKNAERNSEKKGDKK